MWKSQVAIAYRITRAAQFVIALHFLFDPHMAISAAFPYKNILLLQETSLWESYVFETELAARLTTWIKSKSFWFSSTAFTSHEQFDTATFLKTKRAHIL